MGPASRDNGFYHSASPEADPGKTLSIAHLLGVVRRRWLYPVIGASLGLVIGLTLVAQLLPPSYKSTTRLLLDRSANRFLQANKIAAEPTLDDNDIGGQVHILSSESVILPVVRSMDLASDPEFVGSLKAPAEPSAWSVKQLVKTALGWDAEGKIDAKVVRERVAVESFMKSLTVSREDVANVISVTFASKDPQKAANIANAVSTSYLRSLETDKETSSKLATQMLQDRLVDLKGQLNEAERALREFRLSNPSGGSGLLYADQMSQLNTHLFSARIALIESKAQLEHDDTVLSYNAVPDNGIVTKLRTQYLDLSVMANEMEARVGKNHAAVEKIQARMERLNTAINEERRRISAGYPNEHKLAEARYAELASAFNELTTEASTNDNQVTLRELEGSAEALRALYNGAVQKINEINKARPQSPYIQDARIITTAAPSLHRDSKKPVMALGGSVALGLLLGAAVALARDLAGGVFRTPSQVKTVTDVYCGILPVIEPNHRLIPIFGRPARPAIIEEYVLDAPYSRFTETIRGIKVLIDSAQRGTGDKVIAVVSSVANEGKTTILTNLAAHMAATSPVRLLVVDCDLHNRRLTKKLAPEAEEGLIEAMKDPSRLTSFVVKRERSGFDVLPCVLTTRIPNAAELLGSSRMEQLLYAARMEYDFILIEVPPVMSVVDVKMIERFVDRFVFVVEWGKTSRRLFQEAIDEVAVIRDRVLSVVLNKADPAALRTFEAYKGARFGDYYVG